MKAYLYIESNSYLQNQTDSCANDVDYDEVDLLPDDFPQEYLDMYGGKVVFHAHCFVELLHIVKGRALYVVDKKATLNPEILFSLILLFRTHVFSLKKMS